MRRTFARFVIAAAAILGLGLAVPTPASAAQDLPVRAGKDSCGNFQIWVNGSPTIHYLVCNPPA